VWHTDPGGGWSDWEELGPVVLSDPVLFQNADGRLEVFAVGADGLLGHRWQIAPGGGSGWTAWEVFGPTVSTERRLAVGQLGTIGRGDRDEDAEEEPDASPAARAPAELRADFCVIGAGPAGITVSEGLLRAGASVILVESGSLHIDPAAQELNEGHADGPILKRRTTYLLDGRLRTVQGAAAAWGPAWCMPFRAIDFEARPWVAHSGWSVPEDLAQYEARAAATFGLDEFRPPRSEGGALVRVSYRYPPDSFVFRAKYFDLLAKPRFHPELGTTAVELKARGDRIDSVRLVRAHGEEVHVKADNVVLAAGGVENARMLLLHERALATSAMTGRCFMEHPHVLAGRVKLPDAEVVRSCLEAESESELEVFALDDASQSEERLLNATVQLQPHEWSGSPSGPVECNLYVRAEQAPNPDSRVVLGEREDRLGCAQPVLHWRLLPQDWTSIVRTAELVMSALEERHGAEGWVSLRSNQPWPWDPAGPAEAAHGTWGNHHMGTTRMADRPTDGVVDHDCRVHGTPNLYVAGSSVFPTGGCANPTFMIVALAHRLVDHLAGRRAADQPRTTVNEA
jgi:choline dehydrogenase-like flavoprotein